MINVTNTWQSLMMDSGNFSLTNSAVLIGHGADICYVCWLPLKSIIEDVVIK